MICLHDFNQVDIHRKRIHSRFHTIQRHKQMTWPMHFILHLILIYWTWVGSGLDNGVALTPPMGWMTWQRYRCQVDCINYPNDCINEALIVRQANQLVSGGWLKKGYEYLVIDDCWFHQTRDPVTKKLVPDPDRFPHGIKWLSDYVHTLGLKFGIYLDFGTKTCAGYPGSMDYLELDAATMAEWNVDYVKMDGCNSDVVVQAEGYRQFGRLMNATGRPIVFSCGYPAYEPWEIDSKFPLNWTALAENCNLWRMFSDVQDSWTSVMDLMNRYEAQRKTLISAAGPGHWNDPDMLLVGNYGLSEDEERVQLGMWTMYAAPLILSVDLEKIRPGARDLLQSDHIIRINQDRLGRPAVMLPAINTIKIWRRQLADYGGGWAVSFFNRRDSSGGPVRLVTSLHELGIPDAGKSVSDATAFSLRDAFTGEVILPRVESSVALELRVNPSGILLLIVEPV